MTENSEDVRTAFDDMGIDICGKGIEANCLSLGKQFGMQMEQLASEYLAFLYKRGINDMELQTAHLEPFKVHLEAEARERKMQEPLADSTNFHIFSKDDLDDYSINPVASPASSLKRPRTPTRGGMYSTNLGAASPSPATPLVAGESGLPYYSLSGGSPSPSSSAWKSPRPRTYTFANRPQKFVVGEVFNDHLPRKEAMKEVGSGEVTEGLVGVEMLSRDLDPNTRFMSDKLKDKVDALEESILRFAEALKEQHGITDFHPAHAAAQERVVVVGRVVMDVEAGSGGRLNENALLLEGSVLHSGGTRVRLQLANLQGFSVFSGQIVAAEGFNPTGHCLVVSRMYCSLPAPKPNPVSLPQLAKPLSAIVAAGPFCCTEDVDYLPLQELIRYIDQAPATVDLVILAGPYVDSEHPAVKVGSLDVTFEDLFATTVQKLVEELAERSPTTQVVLAPSPRDVQLDPVFPQPRLDTSHFQVPQDCPSQILGVSNPATFQTHQGGLTFGLTTVDVLKHLSSVEGYKFQSRGDRMARLGGHLIAQQSYYPIYPPCGGAPLDSSLASHLQMSVTPDILITPSDLTQFTKIIPSDKSLQNLVGTTPEEDKSNQSSDGTSSGVDGAPSDPSQPQRRNVIYINPGRLTKGGNAPGTFAHLHISPPSTESEALDSRVRVELVRI